MPPEVFLRQPLPQRPVQPLLVSMIGMSRRISFWRKLVCFDIHARYPASFSSISASVLPLLRPNTTRAAQGESRPGQLNGFALSRSPPLSGVWPASSASASAKWVPLGGALGGTGPARWYARWH